MGSSSQDANLLCKRRYVIISRGTEELVVDLFRPRRTAKAWVCEFNVTPNPETKQAMWGVGVDCFSSLIDALGLIRSVLRELNEELASGDREVVGINIPPLLIRLNDERSNARLRKLFFERYRQVLGAKAREQGFF